MIVDDRSGEPMLVYLPLPEGVAELRRAVRAIRWGETLRQSTGLRDKSRTFGMAPRKMYQKRESCRPTALANDQPDQHKVLVGLGSLLGTMLRELAPEVVGRDAVTMEAVEEEWRLAEGSTWTSGVVTTRPSSRSRSTAPTFRRGARCRCSVAGSGAARSTCPSTT